jgi:signal transduction histidine kinase
VNDHTREVVHDLRQPAVCISALVASARADVPSGTDLSWQLDGIDQQVRVLLATVATLLGGDVDDVPETPLGACIADVVTSMRLAFPEVALVAAQGAVAAPAVRGRCTDVRRALTNVVANAARAAGTGGRVEVSLQRRGDHVQIAVEDDGPGFGNVVPHRMVGLRSAVSCLQRAGGSLGVGESERLGGARVSLRLARADGAGWGRATPRV